jgi:hypothetical protein
VSLIALKHGCYAARSAPPGARLLRSGYTGRIAQAFGARSRASRQKGERPAAQVWRLLEQAHYLRAKSHLRTKLESPLYSEGKSLWVSSHSRFEIAPFGMQHFVAQPPLAVQIRGKQHRQECLCHIRGGREKMALTSERTHQVPQNQQTPPSAEVRGVASHGPAGRRLRSEMIRRKIKTGISL